MDLHELYANNMLFYKKDLTIHAWNLIIKKHNEGPWNKSFLNIHEKCIEVF